MSHWDGIRSLARAKHGSVLGVANGHPSAAALLEAAENVTQIVRKGVPAGDPLLDGGQAVLDPEAGVIWYDCDCDRRLAAFYQAHEYAHFWLDGGPAKCTAADLDPEASEEGVPFGAQRVEGYSPQERREREANVFAREFLLPADLLRRWHLDEGLDAPAIATRVDLPEGMVFHQLARALLTPQVSTAAAAPHSQEGEPELDPSQKRAAHVEHGPFLVEAGPGTGKTRAVVGRVAFLIGHGVSPAAILALTFSNRAAEEMRTRIAKVAPEAARAIWMGTFHSFGLELLRKYGGKIGLANKFTVLDPVEALAILERALPVLRLDHYQNLYEPMTNLRHVLAAISRAKDELVGPAEYTALAEAMRAQATTDEEVETAEKAMEVARVYTLYQEHLNREHLVDFGDLIHRAVVLLRTHPDVRVAVRATYTHILVDEYQDVNRASALLLKELAGRGAGLWVVGDARQAIYRFRGAAPVNMRLFPRDFPGAETRTLTRNYRSQPAIVDAFAALAPNMLATQGEAFTPWEYQRANTGGKVLMEIAEDESAEGEGLAREIERQRAAGMSYRAQAVLCRSHTMLARIAARLEAAGVPVLYLGDLFERPEIRDLLALLSLACEGNGSGLVRVANFPEYQVPLADVKTLLRLARENDTPFPHALRLAQEAGEISPEGKAGLVLLERHLEGLCYGNTAWSMLVQYLFARAQYLRPLLCDGSVAVQQRRMAIYQFLQFAHEQRGPSAPSGDDPKRAFLQYVRRLEIFGEEKQLREVPKWASGMEAVRMLTVHASKGLEFDAVYVPGLGQRHFPAPRQSQPCPPPTGMIADGADDGHDEEEECLFFVALSRARDLLCLSRARSYLGLNSNASRLLSSIASALSRRPDAAITWPAAIKEPPQLIAAAPPLLVRPLFDVDTLDVYLRCPRQHYYEFVLGLSGRREDSAYVQFHRCVYDVLWWIHEEQLQARMVDEQAAQAHLAVVWEAMGPRDHPYEQLYLENAVGMVSRAVGRPVRTLGRAARPEWLVELPNGRVRFTPDHVEVDDSGPRVSVLVQRLRTGRPSKSEQDKDVYALYHVAAEQAYPEGTRRIQIVYLSTDDAVEVTLGARTIGTRLGRYDQAIVGILLGYSPERPNDRSCPRCSHYFICPAGEDGLGSTYQAAQDSL